MCQGDVLCEMWNEFEKLYKKTICILGGCRYGGSETADKKTPILLHPLFIWCFALKCYIIEA